MKTALSALALAAGLSFVAATDALAFNIVTIDASGQDGAARFRDPEKLTTSNESKAKAPDGVPLLQSSDGKFTVRASMQGSNNGFGESPGSRRSFNDLIPPP